MGPSSVTSGTLSYGGMGLRQDSASLVDQLFKRPIKVPSPYPWNCKLSDIILDLFQGACGVNLPNVLAIAGDYFGPFPVGCEGPPNYAPLADALMFDKVEFV